MINRTRQILNIQPLLVSSDRTKQMDVGYCTHRSPRVQKVVMRRSRYNTKSCSIYIYWQGIYVQRVKENNL